jgi:magnesium-transporting ATPase (P-type)
MASDYAMPRFRMLPRLLLVHGHWNYARIAQLIEYFFYKNALFILLIFIYQGFSGWSGANFIPDLYLILFMLLFNSIPPIINATLGESSVISAFFTSFERAKFVPILRREQIISALSFLDRDARLHSSSFCTVLHSLRDLLRYKSIFKRKYNQRLDFWDHRCIRV